MIMTIIEEPSQRTGPHYAHQPFRAPAPGDDRYRLSSRVSVLGTEHPRAEEILTPGALDFICGLHRHFAGRRAELLALRRRRRAEGEAAFDFLAETAGVRTDEVWQVAPPAPGLEDRRCEITGPPTRETTVQAMNSGAGVWVADFEDATSPTWFNVVDGQANLYDAIRRQIDVTDPRGRRHELGERTATIMVRPRGWHLCEKHLRMDGQSIPAAFVDFGLFFYHNALSLIMSGRGPYFYLPKMESHLEARLWRDVFAWSEQALGIPHGTIRATCLVETLPAAFEMTEILYELKDYAAGLNAGRWDYLFSVIKSFADDPTRVLPDRDKITMTVPFLRAYTELLIRTCHQRGTHAIGGMAALMPETASPEVTERALELARADKTREASDGFDGSWVAHPGLVGICTEAFAAELGDRPHQIARRRDDVQVVATELTSVETGPVGVTLRGVRTNLRVGLAYLVCWVQGQGAVVIEHLREDAATVEISRMQLWQWIRHSARTTSGVEITRELVVALLAEEVEQFHADTPEPDRWAVEAAR
ncbi:MAG: malate synthase A [Microlunatus sp.]|nr:malate synthase A [Microlunatus sp.]